MEATRILSVQVFLFAGECDTSFDDLLLCQQIRVINDLKEQEIATIERHTAAVEPILVQLGNTYGPFLVKLLKTLAQI